MAFESFMRRARGIDAGFANASDVREGLQVGAGYEPPFPLTARLDKLKLTVDRPQLSPADVEKLQAAQRNNKLSE